MTEMLKNQEQILFLQQGCSFDQRPDIFIVTAKTGCDRLHMYVFKPVLTPPFSILSSPPVPARTLSGDADILC